jgi:hypothetical protein
MGTMSIDEFEKNYGDPIPTNKNVLVEIVEKDQTRRLSSGILMTEESLGNNNPYLVVVDVAVDIDLELGAMLAVGDIVQVANPNLMFFMGKDMRKLALINSLNIAAVFKKKSGVAPIKKEKKSKIMIVD